MLKPDKYHLHFVFLVLLIGMGLRFSLSFMSINHLPASADEAISQLLAESINSGQHYPLLFTGQPYQFPIEAYVMSLFVNVFENGALAARLPLIILHAVSLFILTLLAVNILAIKHRWPTLTLLFIPSAYWLLHQSAYFVPQYTAATFFSAIVIYFSIRINRSNEPSLILCLFTGVMSGLVLSNHLLSLSVVAAAFLIIIFLANFNRGLIRGLIFMAGLLIGLLPYFLAIMNIEGAYDAITNRIHLGGVFERLYNIFMGRALPGAMGVYPPYFPDYPVHIQWGLPIRPFMVASFVTVLALIFLLRIKHFVSNILVQKWPNLGWPDLFLMITITSICLMAFNSRSHSADHRYLLPVVWSFPFLVGYLYSSLIPIGKRLIGVLIFALVTLNIFTTIDLLRVWNQPEKIQQHADIVDIAQVIDWMQDNKVKHCYATFWLAYRFTYETNKDIICAPIYNERFYGWPIPYKQQVDKQDKVAFVMSNTYGTKYSSYKFEQTMSEYEIEYQLVFFNPYIVYYEFEYGPAVGEKNLTPDYFEVSTNIDEVDASRLVDGEVVKSWNRQKVQETGQKIDIEFKHKQFVQKVELVHALKDSYPAKTVKIFGRQDNKWLALTDDIVFQADKLRYENKHPIFGEFSQAIRFAPVWLEAVRAELISPVENQPWTLSEIRVGVQTNH